MPRIFESDATLSLTPPPPETLPRRAPPPRWPPTLPIFRSHPPVLQRLEGARQAQSGGTRSTVPVDADGQPDQIVRTQQARSGGTRRTVPVDADGQQDQIVESKSDQPLDNMQASPVRSPQTQSESLQSPRRVVQNPRRVEHQDPSVHTQSANQRPLLHQEELINASMTTIRACFDAIAVVKRLVGDPRSAGATNTTAPTQPAPTQPPHDMPVATGAAQPPRSASAANNVPLQTHPYRARPNTLNSGGTLADLVADIPHNRKRYVLNFRAAFR